ncbi:hypothetical protein RB623_17385 [Mesorhizobium sp. LHD-90]|uniref:hypothetical protein n=1 Tax=Mesorhizobium sp. LHD-90 TaxID=3071414 RepID=UPI0027DFA2D6|nr:hypothetical protein [Mesorhizobium sp. LHD-90]MDQ6435832.1 hypothetical protein [Mesorhizobium sp. LHD-90]
MRAKELRRYLKPDAAFCRHCPGKALISLYIPGFTQTLDWRRHVLPARLLCKINRLGRLFARRAGRLTGQNEPQAHPKTRFREADRRIFGEAFLYVIVFEINYGLHAFPLQLLRACGMQPFRYRRGQYYANRRCWRLAKELNAFVI